MLKKSIGKERRKSQIYYFWHSTECLHHILENVIPTNSTSRLHGVCLSIWTYSHTKKPLLSQPSWCLLLWKQLLPYHDYIGMTKNDDNNPGWRFIEIRKHKGFDMTNTLRLNLLREINKVTHDSCLTTHLRWYWNTTMIAKAINN